MAVTDPLKRRPQPPPAFDPSRPISVVRGLPVQAPAGVAPVSIPRAIGRGANLAGQLVNQAPKLIGIPAAGIANAASSARAEFLSGLTGTERTPTQYEAQTLRQLLGSPAAAPSSTPTPNFNVPADILAPRPQGGELLRSNIAPSAAPPAATSDIPPRNLTPDGPPVFNTGAATRGTAQYGNRAVQSIPSNYGAGRTNVVPSFTGAVPVSAGGSASTYNPDSRLNFTAVNPATRKGRAESVALARSRELDGLFQSILEKAQQEPQSYGELFARKGTLAALGELAGLSQAAGSNYIQGAGDVLQAETSRYGTDRSFESNLGQQAVQARGQDLSFESNLGQQNVAREGDQLRALIDREGFGVDERVGNRQAAATLAAGQANAAARIEASKNKLATDRDLKGLMLAQIVQASGAEQDALVKRYVELFSSNPIIVSGGR